MRTLVAASILASTLIAGRARAEPPPAPTTPTTPTTEEEARRTALYHEGVTLGDRGDWKGAAERFRQVVEIRSAPKALIALAIAEEKLGHLVEAKRLLVRALKDTEATSSSQVEVAQAAGNELAKLAPRVPQISVKVPPGSGKLSMDGVAADQDVIDADPGTHTVTFESRDGRFEKSVTLVEGARLVVTFGLSVEDRRERDAPPDAGARSLPIGPLVVAGAGLVASGVGMALWGIGKGDESDVKTACGGRTTSCPPSLQPAVDSAADKIIAGNVLFAVGAGAVTGGVLWWILTPRSRKSAGQVGVGPLPSGGYVSYGAAF